MHEARAPSKLPALFASQLSATKVKRSNANPTIQGGILGVEKEGGITTLSVEQFCLSATQRGLASERAHLKLFP